MAHCSCGGNCYCDKCGLIILPDRKRNRDNNHLRCSNRKNYLLKIIKKWK